MLKMRFGALPVTDVKMPHVPPGRLSNRNSIGALVIPVRKDRVVVSGPRQTLVSEGGIGGCELGIAVGRHIDRIIGLVVQRVSERQCECSHLIVAVVTDSVVPGSILPPICAMS